MILSRANYAAYIGDIKNITDWQRELGAFTVRTPGLPNLDLRIINRLDRLWERCYDVR